MLLLLTRAFDGGRASETKVDEFMMKATSLRAFRRLMTCVAVAVGAMTVTMMASPADAAVKHRRMAQMGKFPRAHQRPDYVGAPGFVGGPAVSQGPMPMAGGQPGLLGNGGLIGAGILPQTGIFTGMPVIGQVGL